MTELSLAEFRRRTAKGEHPPGVMIRSVTALEPEALDDRSFRFVCSTEAVDRANDVLKQKWRLKRFKDNPIAFFNHDADQPIGTWKSMEVVGGRLMGILDFAAAGVSATADAIFRLVKAGILRATSVGFIPLKYEISNDKARPYGLDILESELIECSVVSIPANPDCLIQARSMGIDVTPIARVFEEEEARQQRIIAARKIAAHIHARF